MAYREERRWCAPALATGAPSPRCWARPTSHRLPYRLSRRHAGHACQRWTRTARQSGEPRPHVPTVLCALCARHDSHAPLPSLGHAIAKQRLRSRDDSEGGPQRIDARIHARIAVATRLSSGAFVLSAWACRSALAMGPRGGLARRWVVAHLARALPHAFHANSTFSNSSRPRLLVPSPTKPRQSTCPPWLPVGYNSNKTARSSVSLI